MAIRTLVSLPDDDKAWLDALAAARGEPMTHVVRQAVAAYRVQAESRAGESLERLLDATAGLFAARKAALREDGAALQRRLRDEWPGAGAARAPSRRRASGS
jgi:predicted transcriptional regulator